MSLESKKIIGRLEFIDLPEFELLGIVAKIDTGAYNGAIHTTHVVEKEVDGKKVIEFSLLDESHPEFTDDIYQVDNFEKRVVKNSNGDSELRFVLPTKIILGGEEIKVKFSLSNRKKLRYPVLIGRKIIKKHFIVDVSKKFTK
ncbi:MAG: RimK/LysX family protein [Candidatus Paceibacterota bacterium]